MAIVKKIEIWNFQSHLHTQLELADFTAFVGPSSAGKTVVERVLSWVFYNDWDASYPQNAAEATCAQLTLADGTIVERTRLGDKNTAKIIPAGADGETIKPFKDFGDEIPGVFELLNVSPLTVGKVKLDLNFSRQDPDVKGQAKVFLIGETKPAKAQLLGRLYGAHVVNTMLRLMSRDKLDASRRLKELEKDAAASRARLADYADLPAHEAALQRAEAASDELAGLEGLRGRIQTLRAEFDLVAARRWLTRFDFAALREKLSNLKAFAEVRRKRAELLAAAAAIAGRRWLLTADVTGVKKSLTLFNELACLRDKIRRLTLSAGEIRGRAWLLGADLSSTKGKLTRLATLRTLAARAAAAAAAARELAARPVYRLDTGSLRSRLELLAAAQDLKRRKFGAAVETARMALHRAELERKLCTAQESLRDQVFAGGECPVCGTDCPHVDVKEIYTRIKRLTAGVTA